MRLPELIKNTGLGLRDEAPPRAQRRGLGGEEALVGGGEVARAVLSSTAFRDLYVD